MKLWLTSRQRREDGRFAGAILMLSLWLGTVALAASPQLHHWVHRDSQSPHHHCVVVHINHHTVLATFAVIHVPVPPAVWPARLGIVCIEFLPSFDYILSPSRAPPAFISSLQIVG